MFYSILQAPPYNIQVEDGDGECKMVMVAIASDRDENRIVSVVCELAPIASIDGAYWEFSFSIDVIALDGGTEPFRTQEREAARPYIPQDIRGSVMDVVCEGLKALVETVKPASVYWVTKDRNPPEKAFRKYHMLRATLEHAEYSVLDEGTDRFGRRFWTMGR